MQVGVCDPQFGLDRLLGWDTMPDPANAKSGSDCPSLPHIHFQNRRGAKRSMFLGWGGGSNIKKTETYSMITPSKKWRSFTNQK